MDEYVLFTFVVSR
ncbi:hypothetical protein F383_23399 [Gossypium arboreum]|uniref:Uncharacterized protein n=1 Tax=Gossypium arboreum TaxID=29729 RepID=A0A0B0NSE0_GOSAR|nr:hypothetical protein F383_23399 [Gossypium arboreum]